MYNKKESKQALTGNLRESFFERHLVVDGALSSVHVIIALLILQQ